MNNSLAANAFDSFCSQSDLDVYITADCLGDPPEVNCPCCASCKHDSTNQTVVNVSQACEIYANRLYNNDDENAERGDVSCECIPEGSNNNTRVSCVETCKTCSRDNNETAKVCAINSGYGRIYDALGGRESSFSTFQYVEGRNDTVRFELSQSGLCNVFVNDRQCKSCNAGECASDGFMTWTIDCDNVDGVGKFTPCSTGQREGEDYGALTIFALSDPYLRDGCAPMLIDRSTS